MSELDHAHLSACLKGDARAWAGLVERFAPLAVAIARRYRLQDAECDDVVQHTFTALWSNLHRVRDAAALPGWISTTARRESLRLAKTRQAGGGIADLDVPASDAIGTGDLELHASVRRAMGELGGRCQSLLEMLYLRTHTPDYQKVSAELGIPIGSIGPTRQRCLAKLAGIMGISEHD